jgi:hypothetical protein
LQWDIKAAEVIEEMIDRPMDDFHFPHHDPQEL